MTSGNVQLDPEPDRILEGLEAEEDSLRADEVSREGDPT
jgi:hypothetical protein